MFQGKRNVRYGQQSIFGTRKRKGLLRRTFGAAGEVTAEVVFTTGMTGYLETLTDKSYFGQIVVQTFPLIGNYGVIPSDFEGKIIGPCGYIVKEWCQSPSNFRSEGDLDTFFKKRGVIAFAASIHVPSQRSSAKAAS